MCSLENKMGAACFAEDGFFRKALVSLIRGVLPMIEFGGKDILFALDHRIQQLYQLFSQNYI